MTQKERMLAGLPYKAWMDGLPEERARAQRACWEFNRLPPDARAERTALLRGLFGRTGEHLHIEEPFHCDLGYNIEVGEWFYANYNCVILDVCRVTIGDNVMFAPNVAIYAAGHPVHPAARNSGYEYGQPVTIGNNVWLGGNTVVTPGVTIGDIDLVEANEAFAAQSIAVARELGFDMSKVNVNGGAISLGHPVGASGARIIVTLLHEMQKRPEAKKGLATLCIGGGMGVATVFEKC